MRGSFEVARYQCEFGGGDRCSAMNFCREGKGEGDDRNYLLCVEIAGSADA
jgi:hypothetical protein